MLKKIYFGNKPLILSDIETQDLKTYLDDPHTLVLKENNTEQVGTLINSMQHEKITAGIILSNVSEALEGIKKKFMVIVASGGLVYNGDKILLIYRRGKWDLPKGKLDKDEDIVACALREVEEETGLSNLSYEQPVCISYHTYYENGQPILKESHWHLLKGDDNQLLVPQVDEDIEKCEWVRVDKLQPYLENAPASIIDVLETGIEILRRNR